MSDPTPLLVRRYLDDDPSAFGQLVGRYQDRVFRLCFRILGHRQDAEDATQETFTRLARHLRGWDATRPLEPWLLTIAGNRCRTLLSRRRLTLPLLAAAEPMSNTTEAERQAEILDEEIRVAMQQLRTQHRQAFVLFHQSELSYAEIAQRMGCPVGTVKTWVHRARVELIRELRQREVLAE